jgi:hypothetical protein
MNLRPKLKFRTALFGTLKRVAGFPSPTTSLPLDALLRKRGYNSCSPQATMTRGASLSVQAGLADWTNCRCPKNLGRQIGQELVSLSGGVLRRRPMTFHISGASDARAVGSVATVLEERLRAPRQTPREIVMACSDVGASVFSVNSSLY